MRSRTPGIARQATQNRDAGAAKLERICWDAAAVLFRLLSRFVVHRFIGVVFGIAFAGIGLTILGSMWTQPFGAFGAPPLSFRLGASLVSMVFIAFGSAMAVSAARGTLTPNARSLATRSGFTSESPDRGKPDSIGTRTTCPQCGAPLSDQADVSPHGDTKCPFCKSWFNIHGK